MYAQILEIENQLREQVHILSMLVQELDADQLRRRMTDCVLSIESRAEDLGEIAEHQYLAMVTRDGADDADSGDSPSR